MGFILTILPAKPREASDNWLLLKMIHPVYFLLISLICWAKWRSVKSKYGQKKGGGIAEEQVIQCQPLKLEICCSKLLSMKQTSPGSAFQHDSDKHVTNNSTWQRSPLGIQISQTLCSAYAPETQRGSQGFPDSTPISPGLAFDEHLPWESLSDPIRGERLCLCGPFCNLCTLWAMPCTGDLLRDV